MIVGVAANGYQAGKDTVGDYLVQNYKFQKIAYATILKLSVAALFGLGKDEEEALKVVNMLKVHPQVNVTVTVGKKVIREMDFRTFLQRYGTESHRDVFWNDIWVDALFRKWYLDTHVENEARYVVCDVRFPNEVKAIQEVGGNVVYVTRPDVVVDDHESEKLDPELCTHQILNDQTLDILYYRVDEMMESLLGVANGQAA